MTFCESVGKVISTVIESTILCPNKVLEMKYIYNTISCLSLPASQVFRYPSTWVYQHIELNL